MLVVVVGIHCFFYSVSHSHFSGGEKVRTRKPVCRSGESVEGFFGRSFLLRRSPSASRPAVLRALGHAEVMDQVAQGLVFAGRQKYRQFLAGASVRLVLLP